MHSDRYPIDPDRRRRESRRRRLHLACFAVTAALLAFVGVLRKAELSTDADTTLPRAVMDFVQSGPG